MATGVIFVPELPAGRAEIPPVNGSARGRRQALCGAAVERLCSTRKYCAVAYRMRAYRLRRFGPTAASDVSSGSSGPSRACLNHMKAALKILSPIVLVSAVLALGIASAGARGGGGDHGGGSDIAPAAAAAPDRQPTTQNESPIHKGFGTKRPITCKAGGAGCRRQH
jgi:hypothetical protein